MYYINEHFTIHRDGDQRHTKDFFKTSQNRTRIFRYSVFDFTEKFYIPKVSLVVIGRIHVRITLRGLYMERQSTKGIYRFHRY